MKKATPPKESSLNSQSKVNTKIQRVFSYLVNGWSGNRFDAEKELSDHVLPQTICDIEVKYQIVIPRKWESISGYQGMPTRVKHYWMNFDDRERFSNGGRDE